MPGRLILPKPKEKHVEALRHLLEEAESAQHMRRVSWWTTYEYLNGQRDFDELNYRDGTVRLSVTDRTEVDFRLEEVTTKVAERVGQLLRMDTKPKVGRRALTLDSVRRRSMAQLVLEGVLSDEDIRRVKEEFIPMIVTYGLAGLVVWIEPTLPLRPPEGSFNPPDIEVVPPWELMAVPANPKSLSEVAGVIRQRWVPWSWLEQLKYGKKLSANEGDIIVKERKFGQTPTAGSEYGTAGSSTSVRRLGHKSTGKRQKEGLERFVKLNELWVQGARGTLTNYSVWVDDVVLEQKDFTDEPDPPYMPVGLGRYMPVGGFYSRGHAELLLPLNVAVESVVQKLFQNAEEYDIHGTTLFPASLGIDPAYFEGSDLPRALAYEPDYTVPRQVPFRMDPADFGQGPIKAAEIGTVLIDRVSPKGMVEDKGRVDSATGLGLLREEAQVPLTPVATSIAGAYATVYRAMLDRVRRMWPAHRVAIQSLSDDSLAGITVDPETLEISSENEVPKPTEVEVSIVSDLPVSPEQKRRDLYDMLQGGVVTKRWFRILSRKLKVDLPVANDAEWENYRKAQLNNVLLFGDGKNPAPEGAVMVDPETDIVEIHIEVMGAFMARPEFQLAADEVRARFKEAYKNLQIYLGRYPDQMKYPEIMAEEGQEQLDVQLRGEMPGVSSAGIPSVGG